MEGVILKAKIAPKKIYLLRFVLEASGHVAWLSVPQKTEAWLRTSPENVEVVRKIVESLGQEISFQGWVS